MKKLLCFLLVTLVLVLTSCFELIEEVKLNANGSGTFAFTANLSQSKTKLKSIMLMEEVNGHKVPKKTDIIKEMNSMLAVAKKTKGISNAAVKKDFNNFIFSFSCSFTNVERLNVLLEGLKKEKGVSHKLKEKQYTYAASTGIFNRLFDHSLSTAFKKLKKDDQKVLEGASVTAIYKFDKTVQSVSNKKVKVAPSKKAVMLKESALDLINGKAKLSNKIVLK